MERQVAAKVKKNPARSTPLRLQPARSSTTVHPLNALQRSIGNQAVQRLIESSYIQTKLQVSTPEDPFEQEADRMADTVMRMEEPDEKTEDKEKPVQASPLAARITRVVQRESTSPLEEEEEKAAIKPLVQLAPLAVREDDDEEKIAGNLEQDLSSTTDEGVQCESSTDVPVLRQARDDEELEGDELHAAPLQRQFDEQEEDQGEVVQAAPLIQSRITQEEKEVQRKLIPNRPAQPPVIPGVFSGARDGVIYRQRTERRAEEAQSQTPQVAPSVASKIYALNGRGSPLPDTTRAFFEPRFGTNFSQVRVHTDSSAAETARSINARAFTLGRNVAFGQGQYAPHTNEGRRLLAHELTHVVQQTGTQRSNSANSAQPSVVARDPPTDPPGSSPGPSPSKMREPVELKGKGVFSPPKDLAEEIKGRMGNPVWVAVKFGSLASSELPVIWNGTAFESGPPPPNHAGHFIPIHENKGFTISHSARPALGINIENGIVTGFLGWRTSVALSKDLGRFFELHPLHELFGWTGLETIAPADADREARLSNGKLFFSITNIVFGIGAFDGTGKVTLQDEKMKVDLGVDLDVKGLNKARLPLERDPTKGLFAGKTFQFNRSIGGVSGGLSGKITGSFGNGLLDVRGTARYSSKNPKISGSLTVIVTDFATAKEEVLNKLGPDAPKKIQPADPDEHLAITGWGELDFALSEWLTGNAEVVLHPEGYVTARGEIVPTKVIPLFKRRAEKEELIGKKSADMPIAGIPGWGDVGATGHVGPLSMHGSFGAGTLHDLRVSGLVSNHPDMVNRFELAGIVSAPATAGLTLEAGARVRAKLVHIVEVLSAGITIEGNLQLNMLAEAGIQVGRRVLNSGEPEYYIEGDVNATAELVLDLHMWFSGSVLVWEGHIKAAERTFKLGSAGVGLHFQAALDKKGESKIEVDFHNVAFDPNKFLAAVVRSETVKQKGYKGKSNVDADTEGEIQPDAPIPPELAPGEDEGREITRVLRRDFTMMGEPHLLVLRLTKSPILEMSSDPPTKPLRKRIGEARAVLKKEPTSPETNAQLIELDKIEAVAKQVEEAAAKAAAAPSDSDVHTPGFTEEAELIHDYGERFQETDLASGLAKPPAPKPTPDDPPAGEAAQLALAKATFKDEHWVRRQLQDLCKISETTAKDRIRKWRDADKLFALETSATDPLKAYNFDKARSGDRPLKDTESNRAKYGFKNPPHDSPQGRAILIKGIRPGSPPPSDPASRYDSMHGGTRAVPPSPFVDFERPLARLGHGPVGASEFWNDGKPKPGHMQSFEENRKWNLDPGNYWGPEHKDESDASGGSSPRYLVPMRAIGSHEDWL